LKAVLNVQLAAILARGGFKMNIFLVATMAAVIPGLASAHSTDDSSVTRRISSLRLAMGPVSAPHLPGGNPNGPSSSPTDDQSAMPSHRKTGHHKPTAHRHKHSERELVLHFIA
jgi:hypothetical protein